MDNTSDKKDPHKSITINPGYTFEPSTSYMISVKFMDIEENELETFEPESPVTNQ